MIIKGQKVSTLNSLHLKIKKKKALFEMTESWNEFMKQWSSVIIASLVASLLKTDGSHLVVIKLLFDEFWL